MPVQRPMLQPMKTQPLKFQPLRFCQHAGFSLVELLIVLLISAFLFGGIAALLTSNQETSRVKQNLDNAQEAFRYASFSMTRLVKMAGTGEDGTAFESPANDSELRLLLRNEIDNADFGVTDCLGQTVTSTTPVVNRFFVQDSVLMCDNGTGAQALIDGVESMQVRYGALNANQWVAQADFVAPSSVSDWSQIVSVTVSLSMANSGLSTDFVATARGHLLSLFSDQEE